MEQPSWDQNPEFIKYIPTERELARFMDVLQIYQNWDDTRGKEETM
jgi:hypothetical protein